MSKRLHAVSRKAAQARLLLLILLGTVLSQATVTWGEDPKPVLKWKLAGATDQLIQAHRRKFSIPGISVTIAQQGKLVYSQGFGYRNQERQLAATPQTRYRLASISNSVTSVLAMILVERGTLDLNHNLHHYIPKYPQGGRAIKLTHLLSHQSGIRHYQAGDPNSRKYTYCRDAMKFFQNDALKFQPGERYSYSTHAYTVLGAALEHATNKSFRQLVIDEITIKHKLPTLRPEDRSVPDPWRATLYENTAPQNGTAGAKPAIKNVPAKPDNISWKCPGGGLESTAPDLCRFGMKLLDGSLLRKTSTKQLWTARNLNNGKTTRYGLGWRIDSSDNDQYVAHSGSQLGARSYLRIYPEKEIVVVILSNCRSHQPQDLGEALSKLILQKPATDRQRLQPAP